MAAVNVSRFLAGVLGTALGLLPIAPPEHVHRHEDHGHAHVTIHRHLTPHGLHRTDRESNFDDDDDSPAITVDTVYNVATPIVIGAPERSGIERIDPPTPRQIERPLADVSVLIHGPPRAPTGLRAPPFSPTT